MLLCCYYEVISVSWEVLSKPLVLLYTIYNCKCIKFYKLFIILVITN